jgi:hypothetical protein
MRNCSRATRRGVGHHVSRPWHDRLFRALLRLFPGEFRGDFGDQMTEDFRDQRAEASRRGAAAPVARLWTRTAADAVRQAPREHFDILRRDAGYALRLFRRHPGTSVSVLLTLAIGIGLNVGVFSVTYGVLWQPLPLPDSERIVVVSQVSPAPERKVTDASPANFLDWRAQTRTLDGLASLGWTSVKIVQPSGAEEVEGAVVSEDFFRIVRPRLALGRLLTPADYAPLHAQAAAHDPKRPRGALQVGTAVIGYDLWQRQFGGRSDVVGQFVPLGRQGRAEIVGVLEKDFVFPLTPKAEVWLPDVSDQTMRRARYRTVIGRLAPEATVEDAQAEFDVIANRLAAAYPDANKDRGARVTALRSQVAAEVDTQLRLLGAMALCVLLIVLRERLESSPDAHLGPPARACNPRRPRCEPRPSGTAVDHRRPRPGDRRRCGWTPARDVDAAVPRHDGARHHPSHVRDHRRMAGVRVRRRGFNGRGAPVGCRRVARRGPTEPRHPAQGYRRRRCRSGPASQTTAHRR